MGSLIAQQVLQANDMQLAAAFVRSSSDLVGSKVANSDVVISKDFSVADFDIMIDFTLPEIVLEHIDYCLTSKKAMVIGATGFNENQLKIVNKAAKQIPILLSANMSVGMNICYKMLAAASKMLNKDWQIAIEDVHHKNKKDAPSGTAKELAKIIRDNAKSEINEIKMGSQRLNDIVGIHTVSIKNNYEEIILGHIAQSREIFAHGALVAARWLYSRSSGLYSMQDVIQNQSN
jgi:4-hydroxy-tetrahydrodipicolinate reductase